MTNADHDAGAARGPAASAAPGDLDVQFEGARRGEDGVGITALLIIAALAIGFTWLAWRALMQG